MRRCYFAYIGFLIGFIGLIFLPLGFKIIAFFFPALFLCFSLTRDKYNFNLVLFLVILFPFLFIPSQAFTFDASNPFDLHQMVIGVSSLTGVLVAFIFYGVPTLFIGLSIIAIFLGQADQASRTIVRAIIIMGFLFLILYGFTMIGFDPTGGALTTIGNYYISLIIAVFEFPSTIYNLFNAGIKVINGIIKGIEKALETFTDPTGALGVNFHFATLPELPKLPSYNIRKGLTFDASWQELNAMDYQTHIYAVNDSLPIVMTCLCLITGLFLTRKTWEKRIIDKIDAIFGEQKYKEGKRYFGKVDLGMYVYLAIILFFGWYLLLSYAGSFGTETLTDWKMILYIFYSIIIVACVILLTTNKLFIYEPATIKNTVQGTILGVITLKVITMMFTQQTLDAYSNADLKNDLTYIGLNFIFIAPAESLFFFVFLPALLFGVLLSRATKQRLILYEEDRKLVLLYINTQIETLKKQSEIAKMQRNIRLYNWLKASIDYLEKRKNRVELRQPTIIMQKKAVFGRWNSMILFIAGVGVIAYGFAMIHYPMLNLSTGIDYITFWNCGLGWIYFCVAIFFILLSFSFGYQSSIQAHAVFNTLTIWMVIICLGV